MTAKLADVNWLLSALAQSSAALIAIVGGLLVSRYVALHAEHEAAKRRLDDLDRRIIEAEAAGGDAKRALAQYRVDDLLEDSTLLEHLLETQGEEPSVETALRVLDADEEDFDLAVLTERLRFLYGEWVAAIQILRPLIPDSESHIDWIEFRRGHDLDVKNRFVWGWVYNKVSDEKRERAEEARRKAARQTHPFGGLLDASHRMPLLDFTDPAIRAAYRITDTQHELARVGDLRARVAETTSARTALEQERRLAAETYDATRQPAGFVLALQVLTFLALCGLIVPVVIMGFGPLHLDAWARAVVITVFTAGVGLLLRFLYVYASYLRVDGRPDLPSNIFGLLLRHRDSPPRAS